MRRFGKIMSIVALRDLHPGEEVLVSFLRFFRRLLSFLSNQHYLQVCYNYSVDKAAVWYQNNWIQHLMWAETNFQNIFMRKLKRTFFIGW